MKHDNDGRGPDQSHADEPAFSASLESRARELVAQSEDHDPDALTSPLAKEIALLLDHLDRLRSLEDRLTRSLLRTECYVDTELMQMEQRQPKYSPYRFPEREKLHRRLGEIEKERRQLSQDHERDRQRLRDRLLDAVKKHEVLSGNQLS